MLHPDIPEELRGTYAGLAHPVMVEYLIELGITTVELLPVHFHLDEPHLQDLGLTNYWGYNTPGLLRPARRATPPRPPKPPDRRPSRMSSRAWSRRCTPRASR